MRCNFEVHGYMGAHSPSKRNNTHKGKCENDSEEGYHIGCLPHPRVLALVSSLVRFDLRVIG